MASLNPEAATESAPDGFHASRPRDEPLTTHGVSAQPLATHWTKACKAQSDLLQQHKPGKMVGNDAAPEFHVETLPAGTAPPDRTFKPNNLPEGATEDNPPAASETIKGSESK
ncbi:hypothetical protein MBLNU459_g7525t2 [Dothideomycetes sp. NU459]